MDIKPRILTFVILFCLSLATYQCFAQDSQKGTPEVNELHFHWGVHQTFDREPNVRVWSLTNDTDSNNGIILILTGLKNWSSRTAVALKVSWYLTRNEDYDDVIRTGQTKLIDLGILFPGEGVSKLEIPVVSSKDILRSLKGKIPAGALFLGIQVSEVHFADGSIWEEKRQFSNTASSSKRY
jgi:hypothetical protein